MRSATVFTRSSIALSFTGHCPTSYFHLNNVPNHPNKYVPNRRIWRVHGVVSCDVDGWCRLVKNTPYRNTVIIVLAGEWCDSGPAKIDCEELSAVVRSKPNILALPLASTWLLRLLFFGWLIVACSACNDSGGWLVTACPICYGLLVRSLACYGWLYAPLAVVGCCLVDRLACVLWLVAAPYACLLWLLGC